MGAFMLPSILAIRTSLEGRSARSLDAVGVDVLLVDDTALDGHLLLIGDEFLEDLSGSRRILDAEKRQQWGR